MPLDNPDRFAHRLDVFCDTHEDQLHHPSARLVLPIRGTDDPVEVAEETQAHQRDHAYFMKVTTAQSHLGERNPDRLSNAGMLAIESRLQKALEGLYGKSVLDLIGEMDQHTLQLRPGDRLRRIETTTPGEDALLEESLIGSKWAQETSATLEGKRSVWEGLTIRGQYRRPEDLPATDTLEEWLQTHLNEGRCGLLPREILDAVYLKETHDLEIVYDEMNPESKPPKHPIDLGLMVEDHVLALTWTPVDAQNRAQKERIDNARRAQERANLVDADDDSSSITSRELQDLEPIKATANPYTEGGWAPQDTIVLRVTNVDAESGELEMIDTHTGTNYILKSGGEGDQPLRLHEWRKRGGAGLEFSDWMVVTGLIKRDQLRLQLVKAALKVKND